MSNVHIGVIAALAGITGKIYDEIADEPIVYPTSDTLRHTLAMSMLLLSLLFLWMDPVFVIFVGLIIISHYMLLFMKPNTYQNAFDTKSWKMVIFLTCIVAIMKHKHNFLI